jgi:hypothetical protein
MLRDEYDDAWRGFAPRRPRSIEALRGEPHHAEQTRRPELEALCELADRRGLRVALVVSSQTNHVGEGNCWSDAQHACGGCARELSAVKVMQGGQQLAGRTLFDGIDQAAHSLLEGLA